MTDQELFKELVKRQIIKAPLAERVLRDGELLKRSAEEILYAERLVSEESLAGVKSELLGAPYKKIDPQAIPEELFKLIPREVSQNYRVIPLEKQKAEASKGRRRKTG